MRHVPTPPVPQHCPTPVELDDLELLTSGALGQPAAFNQPGSPVTLTLNASTVITIGDHRGTAADIHTGDKAEAKFDRAAKVALRVKVEREHGGGDGDDD